MIDKASAAAPDPSTAISTVAGPLDGSIGGSEFGGIATFLVNSAIPLIYITAVLMIVRSAFILLYEQDEEQVTKTRRAVAASVIAIILTNLASRIRDGLIGIQDGNTAINIFSTEILGVISWVEVPLALLAILVILISGIKAVVKYGSDEGLTNLRHTVFAILAGIILVVFKFAICASVVRGLPSGVGTCFAMGPGDGIVGTILTVVNVIVGFTALVAVAVVVYAGFLMILNLGNDEQYTRARTIIIRVGIGILVVLTSTAIANFIFSIGSKAGGPIFLG
jgi:hypothetical protein